MLITNSLLTLYLLNKLIFESNTNYLWSKSSLLQTTYLIYENKLYYRCNSTNNKRGVYTKLTRHMVLSIIYNNSHRLHCYVCFNEKEWN
jgi:hypothetical protein